MTHRITIGIVVLLSVFLVVSCDKSTDPQSLPAELVGTWVFQSATLNGQPISLSVVLDWDPATVSCASIVDANGGYTYNEYDGANATGNVLYYNSGTASVQGSTMTISVTNDNGTPLQQPDVLPFTWALSGTTLTLSLADPGAGTVVAVLEKK